MTRDEFIVYPAVSASRIKKYYTGSIQFAKKALEKGASFHEQLLEFEKAEMSLEALNVTRCIESHPVASIIYLGSMKEVPESKVIPVMDGLRVHGKACYDVINYDLGIIADVKTTSAKSMEKFRYDMVSHMNHIQAVWYCMVSGIDPKNFYYIGVPAQAKLETSTFQDIYVCRHNEQEILNAQHLIKNYFRHNMDAVKGFIEYGTKGV